MNKLTLCDDIGHLGRSKKGLLWQLRPFVREEHYGPNCSERIKQLLSHRYGNGYVGVPIDHPLFGKRCNNVDISVHGGLTYSEIHGNYWVFGFDTGHSWDTPENCDYDYCMKQLMSLVDQLEKDYEPRIKENLDLILND